MKNLRMQALRNELGYTQRKMAQTAGISQSAYSMIECGRRFPRRQLMKKLANILGVSVDELFFADFHHDEGLKSAEDTCDYAPGD